MSGTAAAVEARILEDPDDAAAWSAYVPWLLAQDDLRGELIALETGHATTEERDATAAWVAKERVRWTPAALRPADCEWRHGFVVGATIRIARRDHARQLAVMLADPRARLLGKLRLQLADTTAARGLAPLADADFTRLRELRAGYHRRGTRVVRALANQPHLHNLRVLDLRHDGLGDDGLIALASCTGLDNLHTLYLQHNRFTARGTAALAASAILTSVRRLDLRYNALGPAGAAALAVSPHLGALTTLHLHAAELGPAGVHALAVSKTLPADLVRYWRAQDPQS